MSSTTDAQLISQLQDAHAMECASLRSLELLLTSRVDDALNEDLLLHRDETAAHARLLEARLHAHGASSSPSRDLRALGGALALGLSAVVRGVAPARRLREAFLAEHVEIAAYDLLEDAARRAGDEVTAQVAVDIRAAERAIAAQLQQAIARREAVRAPPGDE